MYCTPDSVFWQSNNLIQLVHETMLTKFTRGPPEFPNWKQETNTYNIYIYTKYVGDIGWEEEGSRGKAWGRERPVATERDKTQWYLVA